MRFQNLLFGSLFVVIPLLFFYKTVFFGLIPFPGDLLMANYEPYKSLKVGIPHKGQGADVVRELYPWKYFSVESLKNGEFPLWNPYVFSGNPHFASLQSGTLYPLNAVFFVVNFVQAWTIYIILQYVLLLLFTFLYLRSIHLSKIPSLFGAVSFSFCSFLTVWGQYGNIGHALLYVPLALFSIEKILQSKRWYWYVLLVLSFTFSILAGYIQISLYIFVLAFLYAAAKFLTDQKRNVRQYVYIGLCAVLSIGLSFIQLLPLYELVNLSARGTYSYDELLVRLLPLESLITYLAPDFFGNPATHNYFLQGNSILERSMHVGLWVIVFGMFALVSAKRNFYTLFFGIAGLFLLITSFSNPLTAYLHSVGIPFLSTGIPTRVLSIVSFSLAVLGAIGLNVYVNEAKSRKRLIIILGCVLLVFLVLWAATYLIKDSNLLVSRRNLILPTAILLIGALAILSKFRRSLVIVVIVFLTVFELFYSFQKFNSFVLPSQIYPQTNIMSTLRKIQGIDRTWGYGSGYIDADLQIMEKYYGTDGYNPLFSKRYGELLSAQNGGVTQEVIPRTVVNIKPGYGVNELKEDFYRRRALDLTSTKYVLNKKNDSGIDSAFDANDFSLMSQKDGWQIYENIKYIPRVGLFGAYEKISDGHEIVKRMYDPMFDYENKIILEKDLLDFSLSSASASSVKMLSYTPGKIIVETNSDANQLLFVTDNFFPGWKAKVDGTDTEVLRANYTFKALPVPSGNHTVELYYFPDSFKYGIIISVLSGVCLLSIVLFGTLLKPYVKKTKKK